MLNRDDTASSRTDEWIVIVNPFRFYEWKSTSDFTFSWQDYVIGKICAFL